MDLKPKTIKSTNRIPPKIMCFKKPPPKLRTDNNMDSSSLQKIPSIDYIGCPFGFDSLLLNQVDLNDMVMEKVNDNQELMMLNTFSKESNEYELKRCSQERIADIAAWRWVLNDLSRRLDEAVTALRYEHKALRVVVQRVKTEIQEFSANATKPGALGPLTDSVEEAVIEENKFLRTQKKKFEIISKELDTQTMILEKTKKKIQEDVIGKEKAIVVEERCVNFDVTSVQLGPQKKVYKRPTPLVVWERRCEELKREGLQSLSTALITRQQVRGARLQLSRAAQAHASKVDIALRRRLHVNQLKLEELMWQKNEVLRDLQCLEDELEATENTVLSNMERIRVMQTRIKERKLKPQMELTEDNLDTKLKLELVRLKNFNKELKQNIKSIHILQNKLIEAGIQIDHVVEDVELVISLDESRITARLGQPITTIKSEHTPETINDSPTSCNMPTDISSKSYEIITSALFNTLQTIPEEKEEDIDDEYDGTADYPFDF